MENFIIILINSFLFKFGLLCSFFFFFAKFIIEGSKQNDEGVPKAPKFSTIILLIVSGILTFLIFLQPTSITPKNRLDVKSQQSVDDRIEETIKKVGPPTLTGPADVRNTEEETQKFREKMRSHQKDTLNTLE